MSAAGEEACRPARGTDVDRLAELAEAAVTELSAGRGGVVWARTRVRRAPYAPAFEVALADATQRVVVGTIDGHVMGYGLARIEALEDGGRLGVVEDLYTEPGAREVGLGEHMMEDLVAWCTTAGCFGVDSLALPGDRHTKNFFESFGLVARAIIVHRSLP